MNKNGELTTQQIVIMIILILSFAVILIFLFLLNPKDEADTQICHNSVVLKGRTNVISEGAGLDCRRSYVCITSDGSCEGLNEPEIMKVKTSNEVYSILADKMAQCWWMFGEGKINYVGNELTKKNYCSICSQILFDDSLKDISGFESGTIDKNELYKFISEEKYSKEKEISYARYIFGTDDINSLVEGDFEVAYKNNDGFGSVQIGEQYFITTGIINTISLPKWVGIGSVAGIAGGAVFGGVLGAVVLGSGGALISGGAGEYLEYNNIEIGAIIIPGNGVANDFMAPTLIETDPEKFKSLNCEEILTYS